MIRLRTLALIPIITMAFLQSSSAENNIYFRYKSAASPGGQKPDDGENSNLNPAFINGIVPRISGNASQSSSQAYVKVYGNGKYSGQGLMQFIVSGFKTEPSVTTNVSNSYNAVIPLPAGSHPSISGDAYLSMHMVDFRYGEAVRPGSITFSGDGKTLTTSFDIDRVDFKHSHLTISESSWPEILDITSTTKRTLDNNYITVRGGVPPYVVTLDIEGKSFPNDSMTPFTGENLTAALNGEADRGANFEIPNSEMTEVTLELGPIIEANSCSGEDVNEVAETHIAMAITDSVGESVKSKTQTIRYTPNGPHCIRFWGLPRSY